MVAGNLREVIVAAVQIDSRAGQPEANRRHAVDLIAAAAEQGAQLALLPELMPSGYLLTEAIWDCAEPFDGPTLAWLADMAQKFGLYLGTSFLEAEGDDFYNSFVLVTPEGRPAGRVRKSPPASLEAYFYRAGQDEHVIDTALGRIGVGICFENLLYERLVQTCRAGVDLMLQPAAAGRLRPMLPGDDARFDRMVQRIPRQWARTLNAPVVLANRTGPIHTPLPGGLPHFDSSFPGLSSIVDGDGMVLGQMGAEEGVVVAAVRLGVRRLNATPPRCYGRQWALPMPWFAFIWPQTQNQGERDYRKNDRRKALAARISKEKAGEKTNEHQNEHGFDGWQ